jgi:drug/metabolite transporter (DMT)-like permease
MDMPESAPARSAGQEARRRLIGILLVVSSATIFGAVDGISKLLTEHASAGQIVWARYALALPVLLAALGPRRLPSLFKTTRPGLQLLRGLSPIGVSFGMTLAVAYMPLAEATVILFAAPFLVVALSGPLLGERVGLSRWIAVAIGFFAVLLVARPGFGELSHFAIFPLAAAFFYALMQIITRHVARLGERPDTTLAWTLLTGAIVSTPAAILLWQPLPWHDWGLMVLLGVIFGIGQFMMIKGFANAPAALLAPLSYVQIISATLISIVVFHHSPDLWSMVGIVMILISGVYVVRHRAN